MSDSSSNTLKESIRLLLETSKNDYSEYDIIRLLNEQGWALSLDASDSTVLFKSHFLVYHALYTLQVEYWESTQRFLDISALRIGFVKSDQTKLEGSEQSQQTELNHRDESPVSFESHQALRDYYLDLSHLDGATQASVNDLLNQFWSRFVATDDKAEALAILDLPGTASLKSLKQRYRILAMEHHPDRGGDAETFQRINWAFGILQKVLI